ncbi:MAG TPA: HAMP domain-containing sensor histidine kinase [Terriglobales bacterium]|nr:HAMP domain-containing sensor histidine kinase [Terriglobales bacterium]
MKHPFKNVRWYILLLGLAAALILLAVFEYRSTRQLSDATSDEMRATLHAALMDFRRGLENELVPISRDLQPALDGQRQDYLQQLAGGFAEWRRTAAHPDLVSGVFVGRLVGREDSACLRLDAARGEFLSVPWPSEFAALRTELERMSPNPLRNPHEFAAGDEPGPRPPLPPGFRGAPPWWIDEQVPALVHLHAPAGAGVRPQGKPPEATWVIVPLDRDVLVKQVFRELAQRYFSGNDGLDYRIAVLSGTEGQPPIYSSEAGPLGSEGRFAPDAALPLFGPPLLAGLPTSTGTKPLLPTDQLASEAGPRPGEPQAGKGPSVAPFPMGPPLDADSPTPPPGGPGDRFRLEWIRYSPQERDWMVVAQHRKGSLEAAVSAIFYRNLAINFGVLLVLAVTTGLIILTSARARRLAQLQVDFVAGVSHELRTPLTGIVAAAENLQDGLVESKQQLMRYGTAILDQAHQLSERIEQILMFSAIEKGRQRYQLAPTQVAEVIAASLKNTGSLIRSAGITVERVLAPDLPQVNADFQALSCCLENLITNAVKYGGEKRWLGVRALVAVSPQHEKEICITIEDHGIGIDAADLKEIFVPFYRSPAVAAAQIHGNGLGLPLAARIAEAMGGRLRVESVPGKGSRFTLHLPVLESQPVATASRVNSGS